MQDDEIKAMNEVEKEVLQRIFCKQEENCKGLKLLCKEEMQEWENDLQERYCKEIVKLCEIQNANFKKEMNNLKAQINQFQCLVKCTNKWKRERG